MNKKRDYLMSKIKKIDYRALVQAIVIGTLFLSLTLAFHIADPYTTFFFSTDRVSHVGHHLARLLFCGYLFLILFSLGQLPLSWLRRRLGALEMSPAEEMAMAVLCGSALLRLFVLLLGLSGFMRWPVLAAVGTASAAIGWARFRYLFWGGITNFKAEWPKQLSEQISVSVVSAVLLLATIAVLIHKFLFPNGTGDYFSHYLPYYQRVVQSGSLWPNDVWYHFYISKGFGDVFFALILSDMLGPAAVSLVMFVTSLIVTFCFVRRAVNDALVALAATTATAIGFIWTFETSIGFSHWAEFPKQHVITAVLFFGSVWVSWRQRSVPLTHQRPYTILLALIIVGLVVARIQYAVLIILFEGIMAIWAVCCGRPHLIRSYLTIAVAAVTTASALLLLNYSITGLAEVTPFRLFWRYADQAQFSHFVSPFLLLLLDLGSSPDLGSLSPPNLSQFPLWPLLNAVFRIDRAMPFIWPWGLPLILSIAISGYSLTRLRSKKLDGFSSSALALIFMFGTAIVIFLSINQIGSLYRLYMFCLFPVIILTSLPFALARKSVGLAGRSAIGMMVAILMICAMAREVVEIPPDQRLLRRNFALGTASIADAYASQNAVWPEALSMVSATGANVPIWSSQVGWHFCVAPGCNLETFFSFAMGNSWATVMFDSPDVAKVALQKLDINYFAIDTNSPFFDLLPYSPLFSSGSLTGRFGLVWSGNGVYLLTWADKNTVPLPAEFQEKYEKSIKSALQFADFPALHGQLAEVYDIWKITRTWPVQLDRSRPHPRGWQ